MKKTDCAVAMMRRAWKAGLRAAYAPDFITFPCQMMAPTVLLGF